MNLSVEELKLLFKNFEMKTQEMKETKIKIDGQTVAETIQPSKNISKDNHD